MAAATVRKYCVMKTPALHICVYLCFQELHWNCKISNSVHGGTRSMSEIQVDAGAFDVPIEIAFHKSNEVSIPLTCRCVPHSHLCTRRRTSLPALHIKYHGCCAKQMEIASVLEMTCTVTDSGN